MATIKYNYTGADQTFTIPAGVGSVFIQEWGAAGGSSPGTTSSGGGAGGYSEGRLAVTLGQVLTVIVGEGGKIYTLASTTVPTYGGGEAASGGTNICPPDNRTQEVSGGGGSGLVVFSFSLPLALTKSTNKAYATVGSTITYTVTIANTATVTLNNVVFVDTIPNGTTFISNSMTVNGATIAGNPAPPGVNIGDFNPSSVNTVTFQVLVNSTIPSPSTLTNTAIANFAGSTIPTSSNNITTTILAAVLSSSKISKTYTNINDVITYTIPIRNTGNTTAINIRFIDTIPNGTTLVAGSIRQDSTVVAGSPNPPGVTLPNPIRNGVTSTVTFQVRVITIPSPNPIPNYASMIFQYTIDNSTVPNIVGSGSSNTNIANTFINRADLSNMTKATDKDFATINDVITYTITIPNTGTTSANAVIFRDTIPIGTTFVANSFTVNGVVKTGVNPTPPGTNIGTIPSGSTFTVTFQVTVNTIPSPNRITNTATTTFTYQVDPSVVTTTAGNANSNIVNTTITKAATILPTTSVNAPGAFVGNTLTYTIGFKNTGSTTANNIFFTDTTPNGTTFINDSVNITGTTITGGILNPPSGVTIPDLGVNQSATLTFQVTVNTIPVPNPTTNIGTTSYSYIDTDSGTTGTKVNNTNIVSTFIYPGVNPFKIVDKQYATVGDTLTYTLGWIETLGIQQTNVTFVDTIPVGTTFIQNSVMVRGVSIPNATVIVI
ncbi:beta strand repeat-containing protein [Romboutsia sp.]|uniref:beta strand repeat-containing protein n=1 Tax=Romboutsia sp. TaxID=1965302 RepID=UPI003F323034